MFGDSEDKKFSGGGGTLALIVSVDNWRCNFDRPTNIYDQKWYRNVNMEWTTFDESNGHHRSQVITQKYYRTEKSTSIGIKKKIDR